MPADRGDRSDARPVDPHPLANGLAMLIAGASSSLALWVLARMGARLPLDHPTARSMHERPVSRVGGLAIWSGFLPVALLTSFPMPGRAITLGAWGLVAAVSVADDWHPIRPLRRLGVQSAAALLAAAGLFVSDAGTGSASVAWPALALAAFVIVWAANLYNFMDGSDGLAAAMAVCGFGAYGIAALMSGAPAAVYLALAAATLPFLAVNLPPARVFMGDGGSVPLGFLAALFGLAGVRTGAWPAWFPLLVFLPFLADTLLTIVRRCLMRQNLFQPHKSHYYQRLNQLGAGHAGTLAFFGILIAGTSTSALRALAVAPAAGWWLLGGWIGAIGALFAGIDYHWRKRSSGRR
jgi:UDP-GlcNAc:undecaprenyl-phosphate GlcNAc-1-phosphate transferase